MPVDRRRLAAAIGAMLLLRGTAMADQPPAKPASFTVLSRSKEVGATLNVSTRKAEVFENRKDGRRPLWSVDGWSPVAAVSDAGPVLALGHPGKNLLPLDAGEGTVIASLFKDGRLAREITLREILPAGKLRRTISHVEWGTHVGFDAQGRYVVEAVDKRLLAFGLTGEPAVVRR